MPHQRGKLTGAPNLHPESHELSHPRCSQIRCSHASADGSNPAIYGHRKTRGGSPRFPPGISRLVGGFAHRSFRPCEYPRGYPSGTKCASTHDAAGILADYCCCILPESTRRDGKRGPGLMPCSTSGGGDPSFGFVEEPETNGVVERWNRTLKEQAVYGQVFRNLAEVRAAVAEFVERYNQCWRLEKLAYRTPLEAREQYELRHAV